MPDSLPLPFREAYFRAKAKDDLEGAIVTLARALAAQDAAFVNASGRYFDPAIDRDLREFASGLPAAWGGTARARDAKPAGSRVAVHFASGLYDSGGHTALLIDYVRATPSLKHRVVVDDLPELLGFHAASSRVLAAERLTQLKALGCAVRFLSGSVRDRCLAMRAEALDADFLFLHHHPWDAVPVIASFGTNARVFLEWHSDNSLTLGLTSGFEIVCYRNASAAFLDRYLPVARRSVVRLSSLYEDSGPRKGPRPTGEGVLRTVSAASNPKKIYPYDDAGYWELIGRLVTRFEFVKHHHLGHVSPALRGLFDRAAVRYPLLRERVEFGPPRPDLENTPLASADLYIDTFPITGVKSTVDALAFGVPVATFRNPFNSLLGNPDLRQEGGDEFGSASEFLDWFERFADSPALRSESRENARAMYARYHSRARLSESLGRLLASEAEHDREPRTPPGAFDMDPARCAAYAARIDDLETRARRQPTIRSALKSAAKAIYRPLRKLPGVEALARAVRRRR